MGKIQIALLSFICVFTFGISVISAVNMNEGNWEMSIQTEMPGMPFAMPAIKYTHCLTKENMTPQKPEKNQDCKLISSNITGSTYTWVMECKSKKGEVTRSEGSITYRGATFEGAIKTNMNGTLINQKISGRRTGECKN